MRTGKRRVPHEFEVWFRSAGDDRDPGSDSIAAFCLNITQDRFALETVQAFTQKQCDAVFLKIPGHPRARFRIEIPVQQVGVAMHDADFEFQLPQTGRRFAGQQSAAHDDDRFLQLRHLAQSERVANRPQIDNITQADAGDGRTDGATAHRQTSLVKLDRLAISQELRAGGRYSVA